MRKSKVLLMLYLYLIDRHSTSEAKFSLPKKYVTRTPIRSRLHLLYKKLIYKSNHSRSYIHTANNKARKRKGLKWFFLLYRLPWKTLRIKLKQVGRESLSDAGITSVMSGWELLLKFMENVNVLEIWNTIFDFYF